MEVYPYLFSTFLSCVCLFISEVVTVLHLHLHSFFQEAACMYSSLSHHVFFPNQFDVVLFFFLDVTPCPQKRYCHSYLLDSSLITPCSRVRYLFLFLVWCSPLFSDLPLTCQVSHVNSMLTFLRFSSSWSCSHIRLANALIRMYSFPQKEAPLWFSFILTCFVFDQSLFTVRSAF